MIRLKRGDIYLVNFDPTLGAEIRKTRPGLIVQNDIGNKFSPITIVAAITSKKCDEPMYPTEVAISVGSKTGLSADSVVLLNQIRSVDKKRLVKRVGELSVERMAEVDRALRISLGLVDL